MRRKIVLLSLAVIVLAAGLCAQDQSSALPQQQSAPPERFTKAEQQQFVATKDQLRAPFFFNPLYFKRAFIRPVKYKVEAPGSLKDLVQDGKLTLSLEDVVRLVVQRNTDVRLARLSLESADISVMSSAASFDPTFTSRFTQSRSSSPVTNLASEASSSLTQNASVTYNQAFTYGTSYTLSFSGSRRNNNNAFNTTNPSLTSGLSFQLQQPLLRNRGFYIQKAPIVIARINRQVSRRSFEQSLTSTLQSAMNQYWATVQARESLRIADGAMNLSQKTYDRDKLRLELGAMPKLDIFQSEANLERTRVSQINARYALQQAEEQLRKMIAADLDPDTRNLPLNLTDSAFPSTLLSVKVEDQIAQAIAHRPDLDITRRSQAVDDITVRRQMDALRPDLSLTGNYSSSGTAGDVYKSGNLVSSGGYWDAWNTMWGFNFPTYGFELRLNLPIRSRTAAANYANALITQRRNLLTERQQVQAITLDVKNAVSSLEQAKAAMQASKVARDASEQNQKAMETKFQLGAATMLELLQAQNDLASAENSYLGSAISYRRAVVTLQQVTGLLLPENNVVLDDAMRTSLDSTTNQIIKDAGGVPADKK
jgi:outer membrane protein TolC